MRLFISIIILIIFSLSVYNGSAAQTGEDYPDYSEVSTEELQRLYKVGDVHAGYTLGYNFFFTHDGEPKDNVKDVSRGLALLQEAHDKNHDSAHSILGTIYQLGMFGVDIDIEKSNLYSLTAAQRGNVVGKVNYGVHNLYSQDKATAKRAHDYLVEIATEDFVGGTANEYLAKFYYFGSEIYQPNYESARTFAEACVVFGDSQGDCEYILARDYQNGWGGESDEKRSVELFLLGAERGNSAAMWYVGMHKLNGNQVEKNDVEAFMWVKKAAELDYENAMISLGVMYALGQGTEIDYEKSYTSYDRAAKLGSAHAVRAMASMHCNGEGRDINKPICRDGLILAAKHGEEVAPRLLNDFVGMSEDSIQAVDITRLPNASFWIESYPWLKDIPTP